MLISRNNTTVVTVWEKKTRRGWRGVGDACRNVYRALWLSEFIPRSHSSSLSLALRLQWYSLS